MSRVCQVTGKKAMSGNTVSHANNKRKRRFLPNIHTKKIWVEEENRYIRIRLTTHGYRTLDRRSAKKGTKQALQELGLI